MNGFVDIAGYEGLYAINKKGEIWSYYSGSLLKLKKNCRGYLHIGLRKKGIRKWHMVHRLVAETFIANPYEKPDINHLDFNKENNCVDNLEWVTASENMKHAQKGGRVNTPEQQERIRKSCGYVTIEQARQIRVIYSAGQHTQRQIGALFVISEDVVYHIIKNHTYREDLCLKEKAS